MNVFDYIKIVGRFAYQFYYKNESKKLEGRCSQELVKAWCDYLYYNHMRKSGSEAAICVILGPFAYARDPLFSRLTNLKDIKVTFMYGAYDWMSRDTADTLINEKKVWG